MKYEDIQNIKRVITHGNCPDGMASAILLHKPTNYVEPEFMVHGTEKYLNLEATEGMLFCDIVPPPDRAQEFVDAGAWVLDHHNTTKPIVDMFGDRGVFADEDADPGVSGAVLAYREVWKPWFEAENSEEELERYKPLSDSAERFAYLVGVRDTWQREDNNFVEASIQAATLTFFSWEYWSNYMSGFALINERNTGKSVYDKRMSDVKKCVASSYMFEADDYKVAVFNDTDKLTSDASEKFRTEHGCNVIAGFYYIKDKPDQFPIICFCLRSDDTFDVGEMAAKFGGGGHKASAGFSKELDLMDANPFLMFKDTFTDYVRIAY